MKIYVTYKKKKTFLKMKIYLSGSTEITKTEIKITHN